MKIINFPVAQPKILPFLFLLLIITLDSTGAWAKSTTPDVGQKNAMFDINKDMLKAKIEAINSREGIDEATKSKLLSIYQGAEDNLANVEKFKAHTVDFKAATKQAPEQTKKLQKELEQTLLKISKQKLEDFSRIPVEELEQRLILEKGKISNLDEQIKKLETELAVQNTRPQLIREETVAAQQDMEAAQKKLQVPSGKADTKLEAEARQVQLKTLIDSRTAELKMLDVEAISNPARVELLKTQFQLLDVQKSALNPVVAAIESLTFDLRQQEAKQMQDALSLAEKAVSGKHPLIQESTRENIQYSRDLQDITAAIEHYTEQKTKVEAQAGEIEIDFKSAEKKISLAGLSPALGKILREQRRNLSVQDEFKQQSETIQNETAITSLAQFKVEDKLKRLIDVDAELNDMMKQQVDPALPADQRMMIQAELRVLLNNQKELLNKLSVAYTTYLRMLGDFDFARQQMSAQAGKFAIYLDERLLWVPSSEPINLGYIADLYHSAQWLLSPFNWMAVIKDTVKLTLHQLFLTFLAILCLVGLQLSRNWAKIQLTAISDKTDSFYYTLRALGYNLILVLPLPLIFYYLGWFLSSSIQVADFTKAVGEGLQGIALPLFLLQFFYRLFAAEGIARKHFQWQKSTVSLLRTQVAWIRFIVVPGVFIISSTSASKFSAHSDSIGRLALIIIMIVMAVFAGRVLKPSTGLLYGYINKNPDGWITRLRYVWYAAAICIPLVIIGFAVAGYYLSALELQQKLIITLRLIFLTIIIHALVFRWLTLVNRQLAITNARQKRKAAAVTEKHLAGSEDPILPVDEQQIDIPKINAQTIKLLNVFIGFTLVIGFWMIWKNILPAFSFLDRIVLWQHLVNIDHQESYQPITMTNLFLAGLYVFIAVVAVRNFSGVMELLVFRRLPIEAGGRYAVNQLAKYVLFSIGFISIANELGGSWSQVQWLVAALSVGLGFGLQEIFANMVSGIILLFERPIRVGDTVTIGTVTGKVSRIQMRATTLIDMDQKDLIVPNKTFITSQLINWTLSDPITRVVIPVGIAYGSDIELAHKIMIDTVRSTPMVLAEPEPSVLLVGFGDSSLNFSIRIFVSELSNRLPVAHDLHIRLEKALREHKIEIPFPQRDIHVRSIVHEHDEINDEVQRITGE
ncbi:MAG: mechanosensitive ion channel [Methylobacter sp.]|uniref:mechanosensitive ion channel domain-containing protein n=1 Tax=Methylobacter sp. TaxID=2051955 RepID=UPI002731997B|nr:mechanosensitive ion channel domain-containing protein [Methylobacter sp.]MDP1663757.1 mechanosensitive ion channel [Methylobacter sp.]